MIDISVSKEKYIYDIHSLVQAFYPGEEVRVRAEEAGAAGTERFVPDDADSIGKTDPVGEKTRKGNRNNAEPVILRLAIDLREEAGVICVTLSDDAGELTLRTACQIPAGEGRVSSIDAQPVFDDSGDRLYNGKNALKRTLYELLRKETGRDLPWGSLTGIRPVHIPAVLMEAGRSDEEILTELGDTYFVSEEKRRLALDIAHRQGEILAETDYHAGYSLYIGIPFCPTTCLYCSFPSYALAGNAGMTGPYLEALFKEIDWAGAYFAGEKLQTVYIGGGTPTALSAAELDQLLTRVRDRFEWENVREFTVEAGRPDSLTEEKLRVIAEHGATRISVNPQTMQQRTLDLIGRRHTVEDVCRAYAMARERTDLLINMDLILGLPGEKAADVADTMEQVLALGPDDLTIHSLAVKRGSRLQALIDAGRAEYPTADDIDAAAACALDGARRGGYQPYYLYRQKNIAGNFENTGYARGNAHGLYNIMTNEDVHSVAALGAGAISKRVQGDLVTRAENVRELAQYLERVDEMIARKEALYDR